MTTYFFIAMLYSGFILGGMPAFESSWKADVDKDFLNWFSTAQQQVDTAVEEPTQIERLDHLLSPLQSPASRMQKISRLNETQLASRQQSSSNSNLYLPIDNSSQKNKKNNPSRTIRVDDGVALKDLVATVGPIKKNTKIKEHFDRHCYTVISSKRRLLSFIVNSSVEEIDAFFTKYDLYDACNLLKYLRPKSQFKTLSYIVSQLSTKNYSDSTNVFKKFIATNLSYINWQSLRIYNSESAAAIIQELQSVNNQDVAAIFIRSHITDVKLPTIKSVIDILCQEIRIQKGDSVFTDPVLMSSL